MWMNEELLGSKHAKKDKFRHPPWYEEDKDKIKNIKKYVDTKSNV